MYSTLARLSLPYNSDSAKDSEISTALSYIALFLIHAARYFNICLRYPICFNGIKSCILRDQHRLYYLNPSKCTQSNLKQAVDML